MNGPTGIEPRVDCPQLDSTILTRRRTAAQPCVTTRHRWAPTRTSWRRTSGATWRPVRGTWGISTQWAPARSAWRFAIGIALESAVNASCICYNVHKFVVRHRSKLLTAPNFYESVGNRLACRGIDYPNVQLKTYSPNKVQMISKAVNLHKKCQITSDPPVGRVG